MELSLSEPAVETFELAPVGQPVPLPAPPVPDAMAPVPLPRPAVPRPTDPEFAFSVAEDAVQGHLDTDDREVRLYRANGNPNGECRAPCDVPVTRAADLFAIGGTGIVASNGFVLADHRKGGRVWLKVRTGNAGLFYGLGTVLSALAIGGLSLGLGFALSHSSSYDNTLPVALGFGVGLGAGLGAIATFATNGTKVEFNPD